VCEEVLKKQTGWIRTLAWTAFPGSCSSALLALSVASLLTERVRSGFNVGALASGSSDCTVCVWRSPDVGKPFQLSVLPKFADEV
jgi:hypothetical protein